MAFSSSTFGICSISSSFITPSTGYSGAPRRSTNVSEIFQQLHNLRNLSLWVSLNINCRSWACEHGVLPSSSNMASTPPAPTYVALRFPPNFLDQHPPFHAQVQTNNPPEDRLASLPNEILQIICHHLPISARVQLAVTSKAYARTLSTMSGCLTMTNRDLRQRNYQAVMHDSSLGDFDITTGHMKSSGELPRIKYIDEEEFYALCRICSLHKGWNVGPEWTLEDDARRLFNHVCNHFCLDERAFMFTRDVFELARWKLKEAIRLYNMSIVEEAVVRWLLGLEEVEYWRYSMYSEDI